MLGVWCGNMSSHKIPSDNKHWYSDPRFVALIIHTIFVSLICWVSESYETFEKFIVLLLLDLPAFYFWGYCWAPIQSSLGLGSKNIFDLLIYDIWMNITVMGGIQWVLIV